MVSARPTVLLTGACGYIGSHTWVALAQAGFHVLGVDDFSNSSPEVLPRLERLNGHTPLFEQVDVCNPAALHAVFARQRMHHALVVAHDDRAAKRERCRHTAMQQPILAP